jgi:hypothetical protein
MKREKPEPNGRSGDVAREITRRLSSIFIRDENGRRPVYGGTRKFQDDPHWRNLILFYEYFHGDNGAGLGASHQTGWTGCIAALQDLFGRLTADDVLTVEKGHLADRLAQQQAYGKALGKKAQAKGSGR